MQPQNQLTFVGFVSGAILEIEMNYPIPAGFTKIGTTNIRLSSKTSINVNVCVKN
jgi:hypothetical protein